MRYPSCKFKNNEPFLTTMRTPIPKSLVQIYIEQPCVETFDVLINSYISKFS
jgi:hypothetical protein